MPINKTFSCLFSPPAQEGDKKEYFSRALNGLNRRLIRGLFATLRSIMHHGRWPPAIARKRNVRKVAKKKQVDSIPLIDTSLVNSAFACITSIGNNTGHSLPHFPKMAPMATIGLGESAGIARVTFRVRCESLGYGEAVFLYPDDNSSPVSFSLSTILVLMRRSNYQL